MPVFIVHWNRPDPLARAVEAFHCQDIPVRVVVADNSSDRENLRRLWAAVGDRGTIRELGANAGFGGALNVLLREWLDRDHEPYVVTAAHDALPRPGCLTALLEAMHAHPDAGIVSAEYGRGHTTRFDGWRGPYGRRHPRGSGFEPQAYPHGTLMLFRRACLEAIGLFDERYFAYGEEIEIGLRAWRSGWEVGVVWGAVVENPESSVPSAVASYLQVRNAILLVRELKGRHWAILRCLRSLLGTCLAIVVRSRRAVAFSTRARLLAISHALVGRFGPPPASLTSGVGTVEKRERLEAL